MGTDAGATHQSTKLSVAAGPLVGPVLRRVVGMMAARADLPLDRLDDAVLVSDMIAARAPEHVVDGVVEVVLEPGPRSLSLRVGPFKPGGGHAMVADAAVPGVGNLIEQLADDLSVDTSGPEYVLVRLTYSG